MLQARERDIMLRSGCTTQSLIATSLMTLALCGTEKEAVDAMEASVAIKEMLNPTLATMCADAIDFLHSRNAVHRDLKPDNVLIDEEGTVKICDLGISRIQSATTLCMTRGVGTPSYMPPEALGTDPPADDDCIIDLSLIHI